MHIPSYQINNVVKVYSKQVSQNRMLERQKSLGIAPPASDNKIDISAEGKRQAIVERVSTDIVDRLKQYRPDTKTEIMGKLTRKLGREMELAPDCNNRFAYNVIGANGEKITKTLSLDNSKMVSQHPQELVKEVVDKNMER